MTLSHQPPRQVRFGEFELDLQTAELRNNGHKFIMQEQPFEVLVVLLERPGQLVTREELTRRLWPSGTFVDFDLGLNKVVNRLRQTLNDSADHPRFIETLPRKGYRFIEPVTAVPARLADSETRGDGQEPSPTQVLSETPMTEVRQRRLSLVLFGACLLIAVGLLGLQIRRRPSRNESKLLNFSQLTSDSRAKRGPLVADGSRIYATQLLPGYRHALVQIPEKGGETIPFPTSLKEPRVQDISPDGSDLLVVADEGPGLWLVPTAGASPRRVGTFVAYVASWHPDGKQIVYGTGHEVWTVQKDGTLPRKLLSVGGYVLHLRVSPDGRTIRFTMLDEAHQSTSLWEVSADGGSLRQLLSGWSEPANECCGSWTPDGRYFIFQSERDGKKNIWTLRERGSHSESTTPVQLTAGPMNFSDPILAKKGKQILAIGTLPRTEVVRYDVRTREFVPYLPGESAEGLDFSRTGEWVTYTSYPAGTLWRCRTDGSEKRQLTFSSLRAFLPRWSPDAKQIVFMGMLPGKEWKINVISAEGGAPRELFPGDQDESDPTWSPDGNAIAFGRGPWTNNPEVDIRIVDLNTHHVSKVAGSEGLFSPRWSPDGRYIVALRMKEPRTPLLFDFTTQKWKELPGTNMGSPNWSMSGKYVYLQDWSTVNDRMVRIRLSDRKMENIAAFESIGGLGLGTIIAWTGVAPDDSPLLARDVSAEEVYAFDLEVP